MTINDGNWEEVNDVSAEDIAEMEIEDEPTPRPFSWVKLHPVRSQYLENMDALPGRRFHDPRLRYMFMGEIPNMPGHCVVLVEDPRDGKQRMLLGYHPDNFIELSEDET